MKDQAGNWIIKTVLVLVSLSFVLWGTSSIWNLFTNDSIVVDINGDSTSLSYFERAVSSKKQSLTSETATISLVEQYLESSIRKEVLEEIINTTLISQGAEEDGIGLSERQVDEIIVSQSAFHIDGKFNTRSYESFLQRSRVSSNDYKEYLRENFRQSAYQESIDNSAFFTPNNLDFYANWQYQEYSYRYLQIETSDFVDNEPLDEDIVRSFYEENIDNYYLPEEFDVAYVTLNSDDVISTIEVSDEELRAVYLDTYGYLYQDVNVTLRHIFFADEEGINEELISKAEELKKSINGVADFIAAVEENSEDEVTKAKGGSLGTSPLGDLPTSFVDTIRNMPKDAKLGGPFRSQLGVHLIWLDESSDVDAPSFDAVKDELLEELRYSKLEETMLEKAENFSYEILTLNDLQRAANISGITTGGSGTFVLGDGFAEEFGNSFIEEVLAMQEGDISDVILLDDGDYMAIEMQGRREPVLQSFADIQSKIEADYRLFVAQSQLEGITQEIIEAIKSGEQSYENPLNVIPVRRWASYEWKEESGISRNYVRDDAVASLILDLPVGDFPYPVSGKTSDNSFVVAIVEDIVAKTYEELSAAEQISLKEEYLQSSRQLANSLIISELRNAADIEINEELIGLQ